MNKISKIAKYKLKIIEDVCHSINAKRYNRYAGSLGIMDVLVCNLLKNLNGRWGVVANKKLADKMILLQLMTVDRIQIKLWVTPD